MVIKKHSKLENLSNYPFAVCHFPHAFWDITSNKTLCQLNKGQFDIGQDHGLLPTFRIGIHCIGHFGATWAGEEEPPSSLSDSSAADLTNPVKKTLEFYNSAQLYIGDNLWKMKIKGSMKHFQKLIHLRRRQLPLGPTTCIKTDIFWEISNRPLI